MEKLFLQILSLSLSGSYVILAVLAIRICLKKAPKIFSYVLWAAVFFRLLCPFTFESAWSLMPIKTEAIPAQIVYEEVPKINSGVEKLDNIINTALPAATPEASINPIQIGLVIGEAVWCIGMMVIIGQSVVSMLKLKKKLKQANWVSQNIYESKHIETAFVLGLIKPRIYLPYGLTEEEYKYIVRHEEIHIKRFDPIFKWIAFIAVCMHWFNPLVWLAFKMMSEDMELSCDEKVIKELGHEIKREYSFSLLAIATKTRGKKNYTLAFGENDTKSRVKNILAYKKPKIWVISLSIIIVTASFLGLLSKPKEERPYLNPNELQRQVVELDQIKAVVQEQSGYTYLTGEEVSEWISKVKWQKKQVSNAYELIPTYKIQGLLGDKVRSEIELYEGEPTLAKVIYQDEWCYYKINKSDYENINFMILSKSYFMPFEEEAVSMSGLLDRYFEELMQAEAATSDPLDYVKANQTIFDKITGYGDATLIYCFNEFERGKQVGLKGQLMMLACRSIPGEAEDDLGYATGQEWYNAFKANAFKLQASMEQKYFEKDMRKSYLLVKFIEGNLKHEVQEILLSDYEYIGDDPILRLVYETQEEEYTAYEGFRVFAAHIFKSVEEENKLKVFATISDSAYRLDGKEVRQVSGSTVPVAMTYAKDLNGEYQLEEYKVASDGSLFEPSIKAFCTMPVSEKPIKGLAKKIMNHYGNYSDLNERQINNLKEHLLRYAQKGVFLINEYDETRISLT